MSNAFLPLPPQAYLLELFTYEPLTGLLRWRVDHYARKLAGKPAGWWWSDINGDMRRLIEIDYKGYRTARVIWKMQTGSDPVHTIDHEDRDTTNERWDNLRDLDRGGQARNWHISTRNTSGFKGVQFVKSNRLRPWLAKYRRAPLGYFKTKIAATIARAAAAIEHEGVDEALKNSA